MKFTPLALCGLVLAMACGSPQTTTNNQTADSSTTAPQNDANTPGGVRPAHWGYDGEDGPEHWATLNPAYALCGNGTSQSPINITTATVTTLKNFKLNYGSTNLEIAHNEHMNELLDNGHTIQVSTQEGSNFEFNNKVYHLKQFHFHTPSEHTFNGQHAPMEIHFVHQAADSSLAVIGALVYEGEHNKNFDELIPHLPNKKGDKITKDSVSINIPFNVPQNLKAYHYIGSLTTPPCTQDVQWLVIEKHVTMSKAQIEAFTSRLNHNNRPTQPLNNRVINADNIKHEK